MELSDDEELREQLDMHSIIVSCLAEEPLFTAEQVSFDKPKKRKPPVESIPGAATLCEACSCRT